MYNIRYAYDKVEQSVCKTLSHACIRSMQTVISVTTKFCIFRIVFVGHNAVQYAYYGKVFSWDRQQSCKIHKVLPRTTYPFPTVHNTR